MLDFTIAKMNHLSWKRKLSKAVNEDVPVDEKELVSEKDCKLGHWLYSEGMDKYKDLPLMLTLEEKHIQLHQLTFQIMREKQEGHLDQARASLKELGDVSDEIVSMLTQLESQIK